LTETTGSTGTGGYATLGGVRMYYEVHGSAGPPVVLLHGGVLTVDLTFGTTVRYL
jgi:pimeloyl-ACP methyl ester carboxylesterase